MLCATDFYKKEKRYNPETLQQIWCSLIADSHDIHCECDFPFAHLLSSLFPPGHTDRDLTINQILDRDFNEKCLSGGTGDAGHGLADGIKNEDKENTDQRKEDSLEDVDVEELIAAATKEEER